MEAPATPAPTAMMAKGGALLSEKAKEMMRQGKSRQEILSSMR